jgi:hypothetical protein
MPEPSWRQGPSILDQYWRARAEEARARAVEMRDGDAEMRNITRIYEGMAERTAKREEPGK